MSHREGPLIGDHCRIESCNIMARYKCGYLFIQSHRPPRGITQRPHEEHSPSQVTNEDRTIIRVRWVDRIGNSNLQCETFIAKPQSWSSN